MSKSREEKLKKGGKPDGPAPEESKGGVKPGPTTIIKAKDSNDKPGKPSAATAAALGIRPQQEDNKKKKPNGDNGKAGNSGSKAARGGKPGPKGGNKQLKRGGTGGDNKIIKPKVKRSSLDKLMIAFGFGDGKNAVLRDPRAIEAANALGLRPQHIRKLKARFDEIDIDGSGNIDADEFFEAIGETRSPFTDKLFALIDLDGSGTIEFDEYVRVLATYCMYTKDEILRFCFECFDVDGSGTIDEKEFIELCKTVNNATPAFPANFKNALESFDVNEDGLIDYSEFIEIERRFPLVLFPAFRLQDFMQRNSLGEHTWTEILEDYQRGKYVEEYKATHGGRMPPDPPLTALGKAVCPCMYRQKAYVKLGTEMEVKHRAEQGKKGK